MSLFLSHCQSYCVFTWFWLLWDLAEPYQASLLWCKRCNEKFGKLVPRSFQSIPPSYRINCFPFRNVEMPMVKIPSGLHQVCGSQTVLVANTSAENRQYSGYHKCPSTSCWTKTFWSIFKVCFRKNLKCKKVMHQCAKAGENVLGLLQLFLLQLKSWRKA